MDGLRTGDFKTEYGAQWRSALDAYLPADAVDAMFGMYKGALLEQRPAGILSTTYAAHADPSRVNDRFGFAIGHLEFDGFELPHVVFDVLKHWDPAESPDHCLNYLDIEDELVGYLRRFPNMSAFTFDQA